MKTVAGLSQITSAVEKLRRKGSVGFVPTMGALHEGHLSLVRRARRENRSVVASIFVNPLQFGPAEDLKRYPRDLAADTKLLKKAGADLLFAPAVRSFYSDDFQTEVKVKELSKGLCGRSRPVHFAGVATVVAKLLNLVRPDAVYLGQKDYQQVRVIEQMIADLGMSVRVRMCPIVREKDGLAMSSRNVFLTPEARNEAVLLSRSLNEAARLVKRGERDVRVVLREVRRVLRGARHGRVDYVEGVDAITLKPVVQLKTRQKIVIALAVYFGSTRLIDNRLIKG